ncbi:MAG: hypothetical protein ABSF34_12155 [Verrucomicrobiota bacterium]
MSDFFRPNIRRSGRIVRGVMGTICLLAGIILVDESLGLGLVFVAVGLFAIFQAMRGWSLVRACGYKQKA